ncbi:hypothetical protein EAE96_003148 [Botrytis aclada]|nr:hypothetical protein EAE96_003148 [Botrytis aclada]
MQKHFTSKHTPVTESSIGCGARVTNSNDHIKRKHLCHLANKAFWCNKDKSQFSCEHCNSKRREFPNQRNYDDHFEYYHTEIWLEQLSKVEGLDEKVEGIWGPYNGSDIGLTLMESSQFESISTDEDGIEMEVNKEILEENRPLYETQNDNGKENVLGDIVDNLDAPDGVVVYADLMGVHEGLH